MISAMRTSYWYAVLAASASVSLALGVRQTFGLFLLPLAQEHGLSATVIGAAVALHNLMWGISQPFCGAMADRYGAGRVILVGGIVYALGLLLPALFPSSLTLILGLGIGTGIGTGCAGSGTAMAAVSRIAPAERRNDAMGISSAGGSLGQAAMVPIAQVAIAAWGTSGALILLAGLMLFALPIGRAIEWRPVARAAPTMGLRGLPKLAKEALEDKGFALLTIGFFACGFQLAFLTVHLPSYLALCGLPAGLGALTLMTVGLFNIPGSWACGRLGNYIRPEIALGFIYIIRTICIAIFALVTPTELNTLIFAAVMGMIWLGTVPLTGAAIARRFGVGNMGALYGICFFSHQIGGFLGAGSGAVLLDATGSYDAFWPVMVVVGLGAAVVNWVVRPPKVAMA
ncbi:MFS transporter [Acetobacteraceae bacterium H6797]|nr:MFS transporter [Acetobacteraceae bacterium H6797]